MMTIILLCCVCYDRIKDLELEISNDFKSESKFQFWTIGKDNCYNVNV